MNWHEHFLYDHDSGKLIWKERPMSKFKNLRAYMSWNANYKNKVAGHAQYKGSGSSIYVRVNRTAYRAHRIIWEMMVGPIPDGMVVDHINGNYEDNRLNNLRLASRSQNGFNRGAARNNKLGLKSVSWDKNKRLYVAVIRTNKKHKFLGRFKTKGLAAVAYAKAALRYHGEFARITKSHAQLR